VEIGPGLCIIKLRCDAKEMVSDIKRRKQRQETNVREGRNWGCK